MARKTLPIAVLLNTPAVWEYLARQNMSQNELARRLGVTSGYLSQLINRRRSPSAALRRRLQELVNGAHFDDLFLIQLQRTDGLKVTEL
jgi:transcriptional regulator with XRE-family HTH domain